MAPPRPDLPAPPPVAPVRPDPPARPAKPNASLLQRLGDGPVELIAILLSFLGPELAVRLATANSKLLTAYRSAPWQSLVFVSPRPPRPTPRQILGLVRSAADSIQDLQLRLVTGSWSWDGAELGPLLRDASSLQRLELTHADGLSDETVCALAECRSLRTVVLKCPDSSLTERSVCALLANKRLVELRGILPSRVRLSEAGLDALFTEERRRTLTHAHIDRRAPANLLLSRSEVALTDRAGTVVCGHLAVCPNLESIRVDTDLPSLRELLMGAPLQPLHTLAVGLAVHSAEDYTDSLRAVSPPPATLRSLALVLAASNFNGASCDDALLALVQSKLDQAAQATATSNAQPLIADSSEPAEGAQPLELKLILPSRLVSAAVERDLKQLHGVDVQRVHRPRHGHEKHLRLELVIAKTD